MISQQMIIDKVSRYYQQDIETLKRKSRRREFVKVRQVTMYFLQVVGGLKDFEAGLVYGQDRCTAIHARKVIENEILSNREFRYEIAELRNSFTSTKRGIHYFLMSIYKPDTMRICKKCGQEKHINEFYVYGKARKSEKQWRYGSCKKCIKLRSVKAVK